MGNYSVSVSPSFLIRDMALNILSRRTVTRTPENSVYTEYAGFSVKWKCRAPCSKMIPNFKVAIPKHKAKCKVFLRPGPRTAAQMHASEASSGGVKHQIQRLIYRKRS